MPVNKRLSVNTTPQALDISTAGEYALQNVGIEDIMWTYIVGTLAADATAATVETASPPFLLRPHQTARTFKRAGEVIVVYTRRDTSVAVYNLGAS